jgi:hypothetical protein
LGLVGEAGLPCEEGLTMSTLPYTPGSVTSKAAAKSMVAPAKNLRQRVWRFIASQGDYGATSDEINVHLGIPNSCTTRVTELVRLGRIVRTKDTRPTRSGRAAHIHKAVPKDDWKDKRPGWPTPKREETRRELVSRLRAERDMWKRRALFAKAKYKEIKG